MISLKDIQEARNRISPQLRTTPVVPALNGFTLKLENMQRTGSFKERGALNKLLRLKSEGKIKEVVAASAGNHAQAVALHGVALGFHVTIVMPETTALTKITSTQRWGANVKLVGNTFDAATEHARSLLDRDKELLHAFDDEEIVTGQGTLGLELLSQIPDVDLVVIPVGGGGLASGTAIALKESRPTCKVIGVQAEAYPYSYEEFKGVKRIKWSVDEAPPTLGDGISMKKVGQVTLPILKKYLDDMVTVSEEEMANAILHLLESSKTLAEGAGAAAVSAIMSGKVAQGKPEKTVAIVSGGNIDVNLISRIIEKGLVKTHRLARFSVIISDRPGGLKGLTTLLADLKANILQIHHERATSQIPLYATGTDLTLETRGEQHIEEIEKTLKAHGYLVQILT